ncbi:TraB/GumN family protein [Paraburkholderia bannensis]|uniref:TraB/GumN family protein n=1 Tax=Paraburkholderia bannensis TaxID=765414 RepID=UPI00047F4289|nr:TraB/GumN family protein [Paraburkholderia bannensis]
MLEATAARRFARRQRRSGRRAALKLRAWVWRQGRTARAAMGAALALAVALGPSLDRPLRLAGASNAAGSPGLQGSRTFMPRAFGAGAAANTPGVRPPVPASRLPGSSSGGSLPGFHSPPPVQSYASGTTAGGPVRTQPARMPFYVATRGTTTIYLLGTLHVGDPVDYPPNQPFRAPILAALNASPTLALELSPDDLLVSQDDVSKYGVCRRPCLEQMLPEPLWAKLAARLRGNPEALAEIRKMKPWLASLLVETYDSLSAGLQTEYGTEAQLQNVYLRLKGRRVVGLERLGEQMRAFTSLNLAQQREMLAQDLAQTPAQNLADVQTLLRLWRVGDADAIAAWETARTEKLSHDQRVAASVDNRIVYERNRRFVARMQQYAGPNKPLFVAIGALHLGGRKGVLQLLRQRGFTVDPG